MRESSNYRTWKHVIFRLNGNAGREVTGSARLTTPPPYFPAF